MIRGAAIHGANGLAIDARGRLLVASVFGGETLTSIREGATRSPLTAAALRQGLHDGTFTHVVLVKAHAASGMHTEFAL